MEQKFCGRQSAVKAITNETLGRWLLRLLRKMRQGAILETVGYTVTGYNLLTDTSDHLGDIQNGTYSND
jgi:hypothetical protein